MFTVEKEKMPSKLKSRFAASEDFDNNIQDKNTIAAIFKEMMKMRPTEFDVTKMSNAEIKEALRSMISSYDSLGNFNPSASKKSVDDFVLAISDVVAGKNRGDTSGDNTKFNSMVRDISMILYDIFGREHKVPKNIGLNEEEERELKEEAEGLKETLVSKDLVGIDSNVFIKSIDNTNIDKLSHHVVEVAAIFGRLMTIHGKIIVGEKNKDSGNLEKVEKMYDEYMSEAYASEQKIKIMEDLLNKDINDEKRESIKSSISGEKTKITNMRHDLDKLRGTLSDHEKGNVSSDEVLNGYYVPGSVKPVSKKEKSLIMVDKTNVSSNPRKDKGEETPGGGLTKYLVKLVAKKSTIEVPGSIRGPYVDSSEVTESQKRGKVEREYKKEIKDASDAIRDSYKEKEMAKDINTVRGVIIVLINIFSAFKDNRSSLIGIDQLKEANTNNRKIYGEVISRIVNKKGITPQSVQGKKFSFDTPAYFKMGEEDTLELLEGVDPEEEISKLKTSLREYKEQVKFKTDNGESIYVPLDDIRDAKSSFNTAVLNAVREINGKENKSPSSAASVRREMMNKLIEGGVFDPEEIKQNRESVPPPAPDPRMVPVGDVQSPKKNQSGYRFIGHKENAYTKLIDNIFSKEEIEKLDTSNPSIIADEIAKIKKEDGSRMRYPTKYGFFKILSLIMSGDSLSEIKKELGDEKYDKIVDALIQNELIDKQTPTDKIIETLGEFGIGITKELNRMRELDRRGELPLKDLDLPSGGNPTEEFIKRELRSFFGVGDDDPYGMPEVLKMVGDDKELYKSVMQSFYKDSEIESDFKKGLEALKSLVKVDKNALEVMVKDKVGEPPLEGVHKLASRIVGRYLFN